VPIGSRWASLAEGGEVRRKTGEQTLVSTKRLTGVVGGGRTTDSDICFEW